MEKRPGLGTYSCSHSEKTVFYGFVNTCMMYLIVVFDYFLIGSGYKEIQDLGVINPSNPNAPR
jgi:hypothetical protein